MYEGAFWFFHHLADFGWVVLILAVPLSAPFRLGRCDFGRICSAAGQDGGTSQIKINPTSIRKPMEHPVWKWKLIVGIHFALLTHCGADVTQDCVLSPLGPLLLDPPRLLPGLHHPLLIWSPLLAVRPPLHLVLEVAEAQLLEHGQALLDVLQPGWHFNRIKKLPNWAQKPPHSPIDKDTCIQ